MKYIHILLMFFAAISGILTYACKKDDCPKKLIYEIPYSFYPNKDTFNIGDTIWLDLNFNHSLTDLNAAITNEFINYDFRLELQCGRFDVDPPQSKTVTFLEALSIIGQTEPEVLSSTSGYLVKPLYENNRYQYRAAFILKEKGTFIFGLWPFQWEDVQFEVSGQCEKSKVEIRTRLNNGDPIENNHYLLQSSPVDVYKNMTPERFGTGSYCFVVQ